MSRAREQQIEALLVEGCDNREIAERLGLTRNTTKAYMTRLFARYGIDSGIKRVKLAVLLYRRQQCTAISTEAPRQLLQKSA